MIQKLILYFISLNVLFFSLAILHFNWPKLNEDMNLLNIIKENGIWITAAICFIASFLLSRKFEYTLKGTKEADCVIEEIEDINYEHLAFFSTYVMPLVVFNLETGKEIATFIVLLIIMGMIYVKTNIFYSNPTLCLMGYHIYRTDIKRRGRLEQNVVLISKEKLKRNNSICYQRIDENIFYVKVMCHE